MYSLFFGGYESVMPETWVTDKLDSRNLRDIHRKFGNRRRLKSFPLQTPWTKFLNYNLRRIELIFVLNYFEYDKEKASQLLQQEYGWAPVRVKHGESVWTRFYQCYILPERHKIDKRKAHYSNLILSQGMTREAAIEELEQPIYKDDFESDRQLIMERYRITEKALAGYMNGPVRPHSEFRSEQSLKRLYNRLRNFPLLKALLRISTRHNVNA